VIFNLGPWLRTKTEMPRDKRAKKRVSFNRSFDSMIVGGDGKWSIKSRLEDISVSGARIRLLGLINPEMTTEEFFLVMTSDGNVRRRSKLVWTKDSRIGVEFVEEARAPRRWRRKSTLIGATEGCRDSQQRRGY
jgi:hypothetical protein